MANNITVTPRNQYGEPMPPLNGILEREHRVFGRFVVHRNPKAIGGQTSGCQYRCTDSEFGISVGFGSKPEATYLEAIRRIEANFATREEYIVAVKSQTEKRPEVAS